MSAARVFLRALGENESVRNVMAVLRAARGAGRGPNQEKVRKILAISRHDLDTPSDTLFERPGHGASSSRVRARADLKGLRLDVAVEAKPPQPLDSQATPAHQQPRLPLVSETEIQARAILAALWPIVQPVVVGVTTRKGWGQRNKAVAVDLAAAGASVDDVLAAHARLSERRGEIVYTLRYVQDEMARGARSEARSAGGAMQFGGDDDGEIAPYTGRS